MSKRRINRVTLPLFAACILSLLILSGCGQTNEAPQTENETAIEEMIHSAEIAEGRHKREPDYPAAFAAHYLSVEPPSGQPGFSLYMADGIYEEETLRDCAAALFRDLNALEKTAGTAPEEVMVYLVVDAAGSYPVNAGTRIFCTLPDFESGAYREALCRAACGLTAAWQAAGLAAYTFEAPGEIDLAAYYEDPGRSLTATCSALHLSSLLSDGQTVRAARETARSLTAFLLEREGFEAFREASDIYEVLPAWEKSTGITQQLPERREDCIFMKVLPKSGYLAEIRLNNLSIFLEKDSFLNDPDGLYRWIQDYYAGMELVTDQIRKEAPSASAILEERLAEPVTFYFKNENTISQADTWQNEITLTNGSAVWHEMVHLLLKPDIPNADLGWECEAIAEHFSHEAQTAYAPTCYIAGGLDAYLAFFAEVSGKEASPLDMVFHNEVWRLYREFADPARSDHDDLAAYCRSYGIASLLLDEKIERTQYRTKYDRSIAGKRGEKCGGKNTDGNALSYPESEVLFDYLASVYGMDAAVDTYMKGLSLEKAFGISYPALLEEAKEYYAGRYEIQNAGAPKAS